MFLALGEGVTSDALSQLDDCDSMVGMTRWGGNHCNCLVIHLKIIPLHPVTNLGQTMFHLAYSSRFVLPVSNGETDVKRSITCVQLKAQVMTTNDIPAGHV